jgi:23S rRNA (cytosine1962-C5)-methyltransferase
MTNNDYEISKVYKIVCENIEKFQSDELRRLFHGRGGTYENLNFLNIDLFPPALLVTLYEERDLAWKNSLSDQLIKLDFIEIIVFQNRVKAPWVNEIFRGQLPENHIIEENH